MKNVPRFLLLCGLLSAFLTTSGCGGTPENRVPDLDGERPAEVQMTPEQQRELEEAMSM